MGKFVIDDSTERGYTDDEESSMKRALAQAAAYALVGGASCLPLFVALSFATPDSSAKVSASEGICEEDQAPGSPKTVLPAGVRSEEELEVRAKSDQGKGESDCACHAVAFDGNTVYYCMCGENLPPSEPLDEVLRNLLMSSEISFENPEAESITQ